MALGFRCRHPCAVWGGARLELRRLREEAREEARREHEAAFEAERKKLEAERAAFEAERNAAATALLQRQRQVRA